MPDPQTTGTGVMGQGQLTKYGVFTRELLRIAGERGILVSKQAAGSYSNSIKHFLTGARGLSESRLDAVELTCMYFEDKFADEKADRKPTIPLFDSGSPEAGEEIREMFDGSAKPESVVATPLLAPADSELNAMVAIVYALEPLGENARKRVIAYAESRFTFFNGSR